MELVADNDETNAMEDELARLKEEHRDLDSAIEALERMSAGDQLQVQRLKKRKLVLKDRMSYLEDQAGRRTLRRTPAVMAAPGARRADDAARPAGGRA